MSEARKTKAPSQAQPWTAPRPEQTRRWSCSGRACSARSAQRRACSALRRRLGSAGLLGHNDLVHAEHGDCSVRRELEGLHLRGKEVEHALGLHVPDRTRLDVHARRVLALLVRGVEVGDDVSRVHACVVREGARHHLHRLCVLLDGVLVEARLLGAEFLQRSGKGHLARAGPRDEARIRGHRLDDAEAVRDGPLEVVEDVLRRSAHHHRGHLLADLVAAVEDGALGGADLADEHLMTLADVFGRRGLEAHEGIGAHSAADAAQFKLGRCLDHEDAEAVEEVHGDLADGLPADHHVDARAGDGLDALLHLLLLRLGVVHELVRRLDEDRALRLGRGRVNRAAVHSDLGVHHVGHIAHGLAKEHHAAHDVCGPGDAAEDLGDAHVVNVELCHVLRHDRRAGLGHHGGNEVLDTVLLGGDDGADGVGHLVRVVQVVHGVHHLLLHLLEDHLCRAIVARDYLRAVHTLVEELLGLDQQLAGDDDHEIGAVAHLLLLHLGGEHEQPRRRVLHLELLENRRRVRCDKEFLEVVDHHLVHAIGAERRAHGGGELLARVNVAEGSLLHAGEML
mmetsp:Transcript_29000/g.85014  ORF Transcript_29000/g.85014 Transcript_29000/m.85014 type:complete len:566 (-) Transcript_29000:99-1796(-)